MEDGYYVGAFSSSVETFLNGKKEECKFVLPMSPYQRTPYPCRMDLILLSQKIGIRLKEKKTTHGLGNLLETRTFVKV